MIDIPFSCPFASISFTTLSKTRFLSLSMTARGLFLLTCFYQIGLKNDNSVIKRIIIINIPPQCPFPPFATRSYSLLQRRHSSAVLITFV